MDKYQLRVWHPSGVAVWDVESVSHGWGLFATLIKGYYGQNATTAKVVLADSPL